MSGDFVFKNTEQCKVLFTTYVLPYFNSPRVVPPNYATSNQPQTPKLNGKYTHLLDHGQGSNIRWIILNPGDEFAPLSAGQGGANFWWNSYPLLEDGSGSGGNSGSSSCGYEIYRMSESNVGDYIYEESVSGSWTKTFNEDCEILMTPEGTPLGNPSDSFIVKLDGIRLHTGLLSLGVDDKAQFYVKAGQTLTVEAGGGWSSVKLSTRPLKCGGDFFIDSRGELPESFTSHTRKDSTFTFTAPSKTLFIWAAPTATGTFSSVKLNNMDIGWKNQGTSIRYDRMVLDTGDTLTLTFGGGNYVKYCAYPLLDNGSENDFDDPNPEPIVVEDEPVSDTKASIGGAATCTANTSSNSTSLTLGITQKTPDDASLQYAISTSKTPTPTSWTNASVTNNKLTLSISFTAETT